MSYRSHLGRARGLGSAREGAGHWWAQRLTAVALVFAIFKLNPAPFCMLDEVDAPLDDANVGRFCKLVKSMAEQVQFIFITHNKVTMEVANHLTGVTMNEPGVSRLVSVDVDEAARLAAL